MNFYNSNTCVNRFFYNVAYGPVAGQRPWDKQIYNSSNKHVTMESVEKQQRNGVFYVVCAERL
jgi:hypothetical protein